MTHQLIDKGRIYFYLVLLLVLLSIHNKNTINAISNFFKITNITLEGNIDEDLKKDLKLSLDQFYNLSIFSVRLENISDTLNNYSIVSEYKVKKIFPSVIKIELSKTKILAYFFEDNQKTYIGENGKKIVKISKVLDELPLIIGDVDIEKFLNLKRILIQSGFKLDDFNKFYFFKSNRWDLVYKDNLIIKLPEKNLVTSINLFKQIIENQNISDLNIIDLRIKNKFILL